LSSVGMFYAPPQSEDRENRLQLPRLRRDLGENAAEISADLIVSRDGASLLLRQGDTCKVFIQRATQLESSGLRKPVLLAARSAMQLLEANRRGNTNPKKAASIRKGVRLQR
jgi:hypothetical protein